METTNKIARDIVNIVNECSNNYDAVDEVEELLDGVIRPDHIKALGLVASVFYHKDFGAKSPEVRRLKRVLKKTGFFARTEIELTEILTDN